MSNRLNKTFVFVVCGDEEHIDTLNFSIRYLKHFSHYPIVVVTDTSRNSKKIDFDPIIDIKTPSHFDNHQASIFLKTGLHRWVEMDRGTVYCYLDTDVIAVNAKANQIFDHYKAPITFAPDHCRMLFFSDAAVYPDTPALKTQQQELLSKMKELKTAFGENDEYESKVLKCWKTANQYTTSPPTFSIRQLLLKAFVLGETGNALSLVTHPFRWMFGLPAFFWRFLRVPYFRWLNQNYRYENGIWFTKNKQTPLSKGWNYITAALHKGLAYSPFERQWYDVENNSMTGESLIVDMVHKSTTYRFNNRTRQWKNAEGQVLISEKNDWLQKAIKRTFDITVRDSNWQHWNGGVFLFDQQSVDFLETWHQFTLQIFKDPYWKTRDQGTLIATAWKFGLQKHPTLSSEYNFIADYFQAKIQYMGHLEFRLHQKHIKPFLMHIYHHFGDPDWEVWRDVEKFGAEKGILT